MQKVKVVTEFYVAATETLYKKDSEVEVSDALAKKHGDKGTGFLKVVKTDEVKPKSDLKKDKK